MLETLGSQTNLLLVALISALVSGGVSFIFRKWETRDKLQTEYEYEQRKKLRDLIGRYHGRVLNAANVLHYRLCDLYKNHQEGWLNVNKEDHYFHSSIYRFMNVCTLLRQFEREALYVDGRIAEKSDFLFVKYLNALRWCITDANLVKGFDKNQYLEKQPFFADPFRQYCDSCVDDKDEYLSYDALVQRIRKHPEAPVVLFVESLKPGDLRWDRVVAFHMILLGLINDFGYPEQKPSNAVVRFIAYQMNHMEVFKDFLDWLPRLGLAKESLTKPITKAYADRSTGIPMLLAK